MVNTQKQAIIHLGNVAEEIGIYLQLGKECRSVAAESVVQRPR